MAKYGSARDAQERNMWYLNHLNDRIHHDAVRNNEIRVMVDWLMRAHWAWGRDDHSPSDLRDVDLEIRELIAMCGHYLYMGFNDHVTPGLITELAAFDDDTWGTVHSAVPVIGCYVLDGDTAEAKHERMDRARDLLIAVITDDESVRLKYNPDFDRRYSVLVD